MVIRFDDRIATYTYDMLGELELAYAVTVHKSQGSQYETVIIPLPGEFSIMMKRNLIYTAITRARKKVILVGQKKMLFMAIHRNDTSKRDTMLGARVNAWIRRLEERKAAEQRAEEPAPEQTLLQAD